MGPDDFVEALRHSQQMEQELLKAHRIYQSILESMPVGMIVFSGTPPKIIDCNDELSRMFGAPKQQIIDHYFRDFMPEYLPNGKSSVEEALIMGTRAISGETVKAEWPHHTADGVPVPCEVKLTRVKDEDEFIGLGFLYNLTDMRKREQDLISAHEMNELQLTKLNLAIQASRIGLWDMEIRRDDPLNNVNIISWSDEFRSLLGYTDESDFPNTISSFHNCLHPEDFERVTGAITNHMMDTTGRTPYNEEYRVIKKDGELAYFRATGETIRDRDGNPIRVAGTVLDITEEKNTLNRTEHLRQVAEDANKAKSAFLASMSHEIRTPLNAVIGLSDLILDTDELGPESRYRLEQIYNAGTTLLSTVNDILDISKIEAGKFELVPTRYDIPSMINDAVTQSILQRGEKPIRFVMNVSESLPTHLYGDELRIKQILNNLLSNAFKYTLQGFVELAVSCERDEGADWLTFVVRDSGIGIRPESMENLFSDYVQMDVEANRKIAGTGLGLSIAKRLAELMSGQITVESEYGKGSVFTARLKQSHVTDDILGPEVVESLRSMHYAEQKRQKRTGVQSRLSLPYARVLIVDDVATNLDVAKGLMKPYNMQIDCVTSGWEAIEAMHNESIRYNAVFMDHMMPGMDGVEATRQIRELGTAYARDVPIIALTANAIVGNEEMFLQKGFNAFISKPIEIGRLDAVIREWVRDKEEEKLYIRLDGDEPFEAFENSGTDLQTIAIVVPGVNISKGIMRFGNDIDSYISVLRSYAKNTPPLLESVQEIVTNKSRLPDYETIVHGIRGSSGSICADDAAELAGALENAARSGDYDYVAAHNAAFVEAVYKLIKDIGQALEETSENDLKQKREKPNSSVLEKLREACANYEMTNADAAVQELEAYEYESGGELVAWLRENVELTNFDEIVERLAEYRD